MRFTNWNLMSIPLIITAGVIGCGNQPVVLPTSELTAEQKAAIVADDKIIADEESQGKNPANKKKTR